MVRRPAGRCRSSGLGPAVALCTLLLLPAPAIALLLAPEDCRDAVSVDLRNLGVDERQTETIAMLPRYQSLGRDGELLYGAEAWIRFPGKSGHLVIVMDRFCRVMRRYSRGDVEVAGVPHF